MIITEISKKKIVSTVVLILLFFITLTRIDYTGLQTFSLKMAIDVFIGLGASRLVLCLRWEWGRFSKFTYFNGCNCLFGYFFCNCISNTSNFI